MSIPKRPNQCLFYLLLWIFLISSRTSGQGSAGSGAKIEPRYSIDLPTAGILAHGRFAIDMDFFQAGGLLVKTSVGVFDRLMIGVSYGGGGILGSDKPSWNATPGLEVRFRLLDETIFLPAIALGFDSQGKEEYLTQLSRYTIKSMGLYIVCSKNYRAVGLLSFHGGVNYSLEREDGDTDPNIFAGVEKSLTYGVSIVAEYNLGMNDSDHDARGKGRGYLNVGIRLSVGEGFTIGMNFKDLLQNQHNAQVGNRTVMLEYVKSI